jgi:antitoxin component of RelBE/YafQ-DinJ toxin-antitoxin module
MNSIKDTYETIEIKTYAAYSDVAKEMGLTIDKVSTVYEWYLKKTIEDIVELPTVKVRLSGLGVLVFNPSRAIKLIAKKIKSEYLLTFETERQGLTAIRGYANYYMLEDWLKLFKDRYERGKSKKLYNQQTIEYMDRTYETQLLNHQKLYESLQRVHGPEPEGAKEFEQSIGGSSNEDSESI